MFKHLQKTQAVPTVMKVAGPESNVDIANFGLSGVMGGSSFRRRGFLLWQTWEKDADGSYVVEVNHPDYEVHVRKILEHLEFDVLSVEYGDIKPDPNRRQNKGIIGISFTYKGRTEFIQWTVGQ